MKIIKLGTTLVVMLVLLNLNVMGQSTNEISNQTFIIKFSTSVSKVQAEQYLTGQNLTVKKMLKNNMVAVKINTVSLRKVANSTEQLTVLSKINEVKLLSNVADAFPSIRYKYLLSANDPGIAGQYALNNSGQNGGFSNADMNVFEAWNYTTGNSSVIVGILDSGIDYDHPDLVANKWTNTNEIPNNGIDDDGNGYVDDYNGWNFFGDNKDAKDEVGHGTHIAGIIGARGNNSIGVSGVAWDCKLMSLKVSGANDGLYSEDIIEAIAYAEYFGVRVVNCSWGSNKYDSALSTAMLNSPILFICAAGNTGENNDTKPVYPAAFFPMSNKIAVAATNNRDQLWTSSNYGQSSVDVAAPGQDILSTRPSYSVSANSAFGAPGNNLSGSNYGILSGTSMAAPQVAGIVALVLSVAPNVTTEQLYDALRAQGNSDQISALSTKVWTSGRINAQNVLLSFQKRIWVKNSFTGGTIKVQDVTQSSPYFFEDWLGNTIKIQAVSPQTISGVTYQFQNWSTLYGSSNSNPYYVTVPEDGETWTANFSVGKSIVFANEYGVTNLAGTSLNVDNSFDVSSGSISIIGLSQHTIKTNSEVVSSPTKVKHNNWNGAKSDYKISHSITVTSGSATKDAAKFEKLEPATISTLLDGVFPVSVPVEVKDPWFVEADGTQPGNWKPYPTGFTAATMPNGGVFLNAGGFDITTPIPPYYTARTSNYQVISGVDAWFQNWSSPNNNVTSPFNTESAVIFKNANETVTANYKGHLRTGQPNNADAQNQRRMVSSSQSAGYRTMVYESMGEVWFTASTDNGVTWSKEVRLSGGTGTASNPSLSNTFRYKKTDGTFASGPDQTMAVWVEGGGIHHSFE